MGKTNRQMQEKSRRAHAVISSEATVQLNLLLKQGRKWNIVRVDYKAEGLVCRAQKRHNVRTSDRKFG